MSEKEKLTKEAKTNITPSTSEALDEIVAARGDGFQRSDALREAIRDYIAKHRPAKKK